MSKRKASIKRKTNETNIELELNIDGTGICEISTGMPFFEHMLEQICKHGKIDLKINAIGDLEVDAHHTVEDVGICLGQAFNKAIGGKEGINRYGHAYVPLDEALSRVVIDFSGRPGVEYSASYPRQYINDFDVDLIHEFFQGFCNHAMVTLHIDNIKGENGHHIAETIFKAFGSAFRSAKEIDLLNNGDKPPSTKGVL